MKKEIADKWVAALRSGEYKQARGWLQREDGFCCLGVLCKVAEQEAVHVRTNCGKLYGQNLGTQPSVMNWSKLRKITGHVKSLSENLAAFNDAKKSFAEIADIIEKHWEEL